jgi:hypothetical protein
MAKEEERKEVHDVCEGVLLQVALDADKVRHVPWRDVRQSCVVLWRWERDMP